MRSTQREAQVEINPWLALCILQQVLPSGFYKIRYYGFLASRVKKRLKIHLMKQGILPDKTSKLTYTEISKNYLSFDVEQCPCCKTGKMIIVMQFASNAPPKHINDKRKTHKIK